MTLRARQMALIGVLACAGTAMTATADVTPHAGMLRYPDVGSDNIVFAYANDLWIVGREGGQAVPLASPAGQETFPKFSDDSKTIAFVGNYDGGPDLYTIPVNGGIPTRVTHHPAGEVLCDWTPAGDLLFYARGFQGNPRTNTMYKVGPEGGLPEQMPVPAGTFGAISDDGQWLAYTPFSRDTATWKRYRGGSAPNIWLFNLESFESKQLTDWEGTDAQPMWHGGTIYYLSDGGDEEKLNIWSYDVGSGEIEQITRFADYDVKWPSIGPGPNGRGEIVFQNGTAIYLLDLTSHSANQVKITIPGDRPKIRSQRVDVSKFISDGDISATGKRAVAEARGDIWTAPAEKGAPRNLTRTSGIAERSPAWSPDGKWISYYSDATGEYELYITQSDGKGETKQLTDGGKTFYMSTFWSPDSEKIAFVDKDTKLFLHDLETEETKQIDQDPRANFRGLSWSHDNRWITYARSLDEFPSSTVWLYDVENDEHHQLTSGMFPDQSPTFDRKGDYIYFTSNRRFSPTYEDFGSTWIYDESGVLLAVPLRDDVDAPWPLENDEETWEEEEEDEDADAEDGDDEAEDGDDEADDEADEDAGDDQAGDDGDDDAATPTHPLHGVWEGSVSGLSSMGLPEEFDTAPYSMNITVDEEGAIIGSSTVEIMGRPQTEDLGKVTFDEATGEYLEIDEEDGTKSTMRGKLVDDTISGTWEISGAMSGSGTWSVTRTDEEPEEADEAAETVEIDIEGFESRAIQLPVGNGNFGNLLVNDKNQLLYLKVGEGIMLFDIDDDKKAEKSVAAGARGFGISGDGKKIIYGDQRGFKIGNAAAGGGGKPVPTRGMVARINPREEWKQVFTDAWRIQRDWFYVVNMHGVDWEAVYEQYLPMIEYCNSREDVSYVIGEMIAELNIGHAYYFGGGGDRGPRVSVGMLGVDFELAEEGYRIKTIYQGAPWDTDARSPITGNGNGADLKVGEYILAVNGVPLDTSIDPWAAFIGTAGQTITLTVKGEPVEDEEEEEADEDAEETEEGEDEDCGLEEREVIIEPIGSEGRLRYRAWVEHNRTYVEERTDGQVGYIYVPDTGRNGQSDLMRQFVGQYGKKALIIDERWNGGGQLPNRFIELLNRPVTNYFAIRDGKDWKVPGFAHSGPKCMLINESAGSGGDMFPWLFRHHELGKLIGTRTWGGLVGMAGNPGLIDGGYTSVPRFGFFEIDGTWGVEGHGVDPDIEVFADPALMINGADPQLDTAIELMLDEIARNPYVPPMRPEDPDRSGIGIAEEDK